MSVKITGQKELARALESLPREFQTSAEFQILGSGAKVIAKKVKEMAPVGTGEHAGLLKASIGYKIKGVSNRSAGKTGRTARIGPRAGMAKTISTISRGDNKGKPLIKDPRHYAHILEYGSARTPAQPFIEPGIEQAKGEAFEAMAKGYTKALDRIAKRIRGKAAQ